MNLLPQVTGSNQNTLAIKPLFSFIDEGFSKESINFYHLSVELSSSSLAWAVLNKSTNQYIGLEYYTFGDKDKGTTKMLGDWLKAHPYLSLFFPSVSISHLTAFSTLIPEAVFRKEDIREYAHINFSDGDLILQSQGINNQAIIDVYGCLPWVKDLAQKAFPAAREFHHSAVLVNALAQKEDAVFVNMHDDSFDVLISKGKQLQLFNTYHYKTKEDFIYFLLNTCDQLQVNLDETAVTLYGRIEKSSQIVEIARKYIRQVNFGKRPEQFKYSAKMTELPEHYFFNLFSQYLCV